jgi:hypothetical protein
MHATAASVAHTWIQLFLCLQLCLPAVFCAEMAAAEIISELSLQRWRCVHQAGLSVVASLLVFPGCADVTALAAWRMVCAPDTLQVPCICRVLISCGFSCGFCGSARKSLCPACLLRQLLSVCGALLLTLWHSVPGVMWLFVMLPSNSVGCCLVRGHVARSVMHMPCLWEHELCTCQ